MPTGSSRKRSEDRFAETLKRMKIGDPREKAKHDIVTWDLIIKAHGFVAEYCMRGKAEQQQSQCLMNRDWID